MGCQSHSTARTHFAYHFAALPVCRDKIAAAGGAAAPLNPRPTTLRSRLDASGVQPAAFKTRR
jgi:hypothetical protein